MTGNIIRVLLIEDEPSDADYIRELLSEQVPPRYETEIRDRLQSGIERLKQGGIDVLLLDLSLPDSHGFNTVSVTTSLLPHIPIIVLTGIDDENMAIEAVKVGAQDYIIKGQVGADLLSRAIRYAIERKKLLDCQEAQKSLQESELKFRSLFNFLPQAITLSEIATGKLIDVNDMFCKTTQYSRKEVMGRFITELGLYSQKDRDRFLNELMVSAKTCGFEMDLRIKNGSIINTRMFARNIQLGKQSFLLTIYINITEQKRLESQLQQAQKMEALGTLVAGVAHEINNPNNFITLNAPMLHKAWQSIFPVLEQYYDNTGDFDVGGLPFTMMRERMPQLLAGISEGSGRIKKIVSDLKRFAQPNELLPFEPVDVNGVVKSSLTLVSNLLKNATNNFKVEYGQNIPKVNGNYQQLEQVIINLVQNACQALPDRSKGIYVSTVYQEMSDTVLIKVRDEGVGIPVESLSKVMDPFFTSRRSSGGTGLGLSVSSSIIKEHSGELTISSEEGKGTTFLVALPYGVKKQLPKVLIVDDDDLVREMLVKTFKQNFKLPVEEASDGMDACFKLGTYQPDLLILDIRMPDMNGLEVCKRIKSESFFTNMKTIIITGFPGSDDVVKIAEMGFTNLCPKPLRMKELQAMVQEVLNSN